MAKKKRFDPNQVINSAIEEGIEEILQHHPRFKRFGGYIAENIDKKKLRARADEIYKEMGSLNLTGEQQIKYIHEKISDYVASGKVLNEAGQRVILKKGLKEEAERPGVINYLTRRRAKRELEGERNIDIALGAWGEIYQQFKSGNYDMPELEKPLEYLSRAGFANTAADILKEADLINSSQYRQIKERTRSGIRESQKEAYGGLERMSEYQKIAASILGFFGIGVIVASGMQITGGVVGVENLENNVAGMTAGIMLLISSLVLFLRKK